MNQTTRYRSAIVALFIAALGCAPSQNEAYLDLTWEEFDQSRDSGWRPLAEAQDYAGAASMIENYLRYRDDLAPAQRGYSIFHAGQLWALHGETERALALLDQATVEVLPQEFPRAFNPLVAGTRAFLRDDMAAVRAARDEVAAMAGRVPRDDQFLEALELLTSSEGLTYQEVYARAVEKK